LTTTIDAPPAYENCDNAAGGDTTDFIMDENGGYDDEASDHDNLAPEEAGDVVHEAGAEAVTFPFEGDRNTKYFTERASGTWSGLSGVAITIWNGFLDG
jgi:hypothetical protein